MAGTNNFGGRKKSSKKYVCIYHQFERDFSASKHIRSTFVIKLKKKYSLVLLNIMTCLRHYILITLSIVVKTNIVHTPEVENLCNRLMYVYHIL